MEMKFNFLILICLGFGVDFCLANEKVYVVCEGSDDTYLCYTTQTDRFYKIKTPEIDQLFKTSEGDVTSNDLQVSSNNVRNTQSYFPLRPPHEKRGYSRFSRLYFKDRILNRFGLHPFYGRHYSTYRKRPFDSIAYTGSFGGFGKK